MLRGNVVEGTAKFRVANDCPIDGVYDSQIGDLYASAPAEDEIGGFDVVMRNSLPMRVGHAVSHQGHNADFLGKTEIAESLQRTVQAFTVHVFHYQVRVSVLEAGIVDL